MDHFGIGAGIAGAVEIYLRAGRRTGRTTSLVDSVKDGDCIVFADRREAERVRGLCAERGVKVDCVVLPARDLTALFHTSPSEGRTIFDHGWVEQFYLQEIARAQELIDRWQRETSSYGEAHRETLRRAEEITRWRR